MTTFLGLRGKTYSYLTDHIREGKKQKTRKTVS